MYDMDTKEESSLTPYGILNGAEGHLTEGSPFGVASARFALQTAMELLRKGYGLHDEVKPLLDKYTYAENVPQNRLNEENVLRTIDQIHKNLKDSKNA